MSSLLASAHWRHSSLPLSGVLLTSLCLGGWLAVRLRTPAPVAIGLHATALRALSPAQPSAAPAFQTEVAAVHALLLYRQAEHACQRRQFSQAAALLARLAAAPGLNSAQVAFVQQQRRLCLQDAGLPAPLLPAVAPRAVAPSTTSRPLAPADADCGPRALLLACEQMGIKTSLPVLRQAAGTNGQGTSLAGLAVAAKGVGLQAEGVQVSRAALPDLDMPALAYVNGNHFIAVLAVQGHGESGTAVIDDPNSMQEQTISQERLLRLCSGYLLLLHK